VQLVIMEATGTYWRPFFFYLLEERGLRCWLVNAREVKNVPVRPKTDKLDAVWLAKLAERGMVRASFVPPKPVRQLRDFTRTRTVFTQERSRHKQRADKVLQDAQIKLSSVATDIFGVSGRAMMDALIAGQRSPRTSQVAPARRLRTGSAGHVIRLGRMSITVTTWSLEQTSQADLKASPEPDPARGVRIVRAEVPSAEFNRFLYTAVGADCTWTDRLPWKREQWQAYLERRGVETWVAYERGTPAGYIELDPQAEGQVEIGYFGLLPAFRGRRIGGHLLSYGIARAWDLGERWPDRAPTKRVWVHTCSLDGPHALANYERRGFRIFRTKVGEEGEKPVDLGGMWTS
jgi:ribosomal protein S18 acetylase RimI-like enzyme